MIELRKGENTCKDWKEDLMDIYCITQNAALFVSTMKYFGWTKGSINKSDIIFDFRGWFVILVYFDAVKNKNTLWDLRHKAVLIAVRNRLEGD